MYSNYIIELRRRLKGLREGDNLSQLNLAKKLGRTQASISRFENSKEHERISVFSVLEYANAVGYKMEINFIKK